MRTGSSWALLPGALAALSGCVSMPGLLTARTLPPHKVELVLAPGVAVFQGVLENFTGGPVANAAVRYGVTGDLDLGMRLSTIALVDARARLVDRRWLAVAVAPAVGCAFFSGCAPMGELPLLLEVGRADGLRLTLAAKWAIRYDSPHLLQGPAAEVSLTVPTLGGLEMRPWLHMARGSGSTHGPSGGRLA